ncbi:MAG TPA: hypothetical protein VM406_04835 [Noviherbaspirillum sp.]|nr:hypothetical protein [Noviherbaspirillum sp.]
MVLAANQVLFNGNGIGYEAFSTSGAYGQAPGTNAPLSSFGLRVYQEGMAGQSNTVRVALEMDQTDGSALLQMLVDRATLSISETGALSITVPDNANAYVVVNDGAGNSATVSTSEIADNVIRFAPIADDPTSFGLIVDVDAIATAAAAASPQAATALQTLRTLAARYDMRMAITGVGLRSSGGNDLTAGTTPITVGDQPAVSGGGVAGVFLGGGLTP